MIIILIGVLIFFSTIGLFVYWEIDDYKWRKAEINDMITRIKQKYNNYD